MSYIKNSLPDDWEPISIFDQIPGKYKYLCIGNTSVEAEWLPRWYGVPHDECLFNYPDDEYGPAVPLIRLRALPKGTNYKQHLKIIKTEHLLRSE